MVSILIRKAPSQWVAKALTSETKTQMKSAHRWTEWIFCPWKLNSHGQFFKAWKLFLLSPPLLTKGKNTVRNKGLWAASYLNSTENTIYGKQVYASATGFHTCWKLSTASSSVGKHRGWKAENAGFGASCRSRQKTTFCLSLGAQGCHGNGFNYALSFIAKIFHWETIKKHFQTWFPKFWKRS